MQEMAVLGSMFGANQHADAIPPLFKIFGVFTLPFASREKV
jgi:hypothetical protein